MDKLDLKEAAFWTGVVGCGVAVVPAACTGLITYSKVIVVNWMINLPIRILSAGKIRVHVYDISLVHVPFLWKASLISAKIGGLIVLISLIVGLANYVFTECKRRRS